MNRSHAARIAFALLPFFLLGWFPSSAGAEVQPELETLGLVECVNLALERDAGFRAAVAEREEVLGAVDEAAADAWPQLDLTSRWGRSRNPSLLTSPDFDDILEQFPNFEPGEQELWGLAVEVEQTLYSGGKVQAAIDLARIAVDVYESRLETRRLELAVSVAETFYAVLDARAALRTLKIQEESRRAALEVVQARYEIGEATELERLQSKAALAELGPTAADLEGELASSLSSMQRLLGLDQPPELAEPERRSIDSVPDEEALYRLAVSRRPELADLAGQKEGLERQQKIVEAEARPQLELRGAYGRQARLPEDLADSLFDDWRVDVSFTWSLFDGGRRRGELRQIESQRDQVQWRLLELERRVRDELRQALYAREASCTRFAAAEVSAAAAIEAERVASEAYGLGVALQADLLDASDRATQQSLLKDRAYYECLAAGVQLKARAGLMPDEVLAGAGSSAEVEEQP